MNCGLPGRFGADMHISSRKRALFSFLSLFIIISLTITNILYAEKSSRLSSEGYIEKRAEYFTPSAFGKEERVKEFKWFHEAAKLLRG
jgi:hypothetical protein